MSAFHDIHLSELATARTFTDDDGCLCLRVDDRETHLVVRMPVAPPQVPLLLWSALRDGIASVGYGSEVAA